MLVLSAYSPDEQSVGVKQVVPLSKVPAGQTQLKLSSITYGEVHLVHLGLKLLQTAQWGVTALQDAQSPALVL